MLDVLGKIWLYGIAVMIIITPFALFIILHLWAKRRVNRSDYKSRYEDEKIEKEKWKNIAISNDKEIKEIKKTWKSPWDQERDNSSKNINVSFNSSIPINKIAKAIPEEMSKEDLEKCINYYIEKYPKG